MKILIAALLVTASVSAQEPAKPPAARPSDVASIDAIIAAVYDVISGPAGQKRDWDRMRSLFVPGARLIPASPTPDGGTTARVLDVEGYIQRAGPTLERGFFESEISRKADVFDNIAQVFSTYESRHAKDDAQPFARGINSFQLMRDGDRWWVVTIYWEAERPGHEIPAQYLPRK